MTTSANTAVDAFWQTYLTTLPPDTQLRPVTYTAWSFGDGPEMADALGQLVKAGAKIATCSLLWEYEADGESIPQVGELSIILDGQGEPLCIIETTEIEIKPYSEVDARFAHDEGEGDRSLAFWRAAHWRFFGRSCARIGRQPAETMPLVCERFRCIYP